jgi:hypothetical protein
MGGFRCKCFALCHDAYIIAAYPFSLAILPARLHILFTFAMAEFAALSVAASILQVVNVGIRVIKRLNEYGDKANGLPDAFKHINKRLPIFIDALW